METRSGLNEIVTPLGVGDRGEVDRVCAKREGEGIGGNSCLAAKWRAMLDRRRTSRTGGLGFGSWLPSHAPPTLDARDGDAERCRCGRMGEPGAGVQTAGGRRPLATEACASRPSPCKPCLHALDNPSALELRDGAQNVHLELPGRRRRVDPFRERNEPDPEGLQLVEQRDQMFEVAAEPVKPPADHDVQPAPFGVRPSSPTTHRSPVESVRSPGHRPVS
jgi:hypothetical protein